MSNATDGHDDDSFASLFEKAGTTVTRQRRLSIGDEVEGVVAKVGHDALFLDLDGKREAFVERAFLVDGEGKPIEMQVGDGLRARVAEIGGKAGAVRLEPIAIKRARAPVDDYPGDVAEEHVELVGGGTGPRLATGAHVHGEIVRIETYGVFVQLEGTTGREGRGLLPAAETGLPRGTDLRKKLPMGTKVDAKILSIEDDGKMRLSIRALQADEERASFEKFTGKDANAVGSARGLGSLADAFTRKKGQKTKKR